MFWLYERKPKILKGIKHPNSKLTWKMVREMREDHAKGGMSYPQLAKKYRISKSAVGRIIRREAWIEDPKDKAEA